VRLFTFSVLLVLLVPAQLFAANIPVTLTEKYTEVPAYAPGSVVVRRILVTYNGSGPAEYTASLQLPDGFRLLSGSQVLVFQRPGTDLLLVSFKIPTTAQAGDYSGTLKLENSRSGFGELIIPFRILPVMKLRTTLLEQPDYLLAGAAYRVVFACANDGNVPLTADATATSSAGFDIRVEASRFALLPGETRQLAVIIATPLDLYTQVKNIVRLDLRAVENELIRISSTSIVDIIPRTTGKESRYNFIPGKISAEGVFQHGGSDAYGLQAQITGQGALDETGSTRIFFQALQPLTGAGTLVPDQNEYFMKVTGSDYSTALGTQFFSLSPLVESSQYGAGISVSRTYGPLGFSAFTMDNLLGGRQENRSGGKINYRFKDWGVAAFNLMDAAADDGGRWTSGSLEGHFLTPTGNRLEWEYASSTEDRSDDAIFASLGGSTDVFSYFFKYLRAGPWYRGSLEDVGQSLLSFNYRPARTVQLNAMFSSRGNRLAQEFPDRLDSSQLGVSWATAKGTRITADFLSNAERRREGIPAYFVERENFRMGMQQKSGTADLGISYEFGTLYNHAESKRTFSERMNTTLDIAAGELGDLKTSMGFTFRDAESAKVPFSDVALSWNKKLNSRTVVSATYRTINSGRSFYQGADNLSLKLSMLFPDQSNLAVTATYGPSRISGSSEDFSVTMGYSSPLQIPVSVKKNTGRVEGKVTDAETGKALPDVLLRIGSSVAATDPFGHYQFHSLFPGVHRLYVDPASLPSGFIPVENMPLEITSDGSTAEKNILATKASSIKGRIVVFRFDQNYAQTRIDAAPAYVDPQGMAGVLLTVEGPGGSRKALSGDDGTFMFPPLRQGRWTLKVPASAIQEGAFAEKTSFEFNLGPGQTDEFTIKIYPKARQIKFIDQGTVSEEIQVEDMNVDETMPSEEAAPILDD